MPCSVAQEQAGRPSRAWGWKGEGSSREPWVLGSFSASQSISCGMQGPGQGPQHSLPEPPAMLSASPTWTEVEEGPAGILTQYKISCNSSCLYPALSLCLRPDKLLPGKTWFLSQLGVALSLKAYCWDIQDTGSSLKGWLRDAGIG